MTTPTRLYISIDRSGDAPRYIASQDMHPGAEEWVRKPSMEAREAFMDAVWAALKADANDLRKQQRIARALGDLLLSPPGAQEGE